jgi:hypothetical protein
MLDKMNIEKYMRVIRNLPEKTTFKYSDLLINDLLIENENNLQMYFAPFDYINYKAKIIIIGITPGFSQMEIAIKYH